MDTPSIRTAFTRVRAYPSCAVVCKPRWKRANITPSRRSVRPVEGAYASIARFVVCFFSFFFSSISANYTRRKPSLVTLTVVFLVSGVFPGQHVAEIVHRTRYHSTARNLARRDLPVFAQPPLVLTFSMCRRRFDDTCARDAILTDHDASLFSLPNADTSSKMVNAVTT